MEDNMQTQTSLTAASVQHIARQRRLQRGQGMTEYIIIVALIAVAAIGAFTYFGQTIRSQTAGIANEVAGKPADDQITAAGKAAGGVADEAKKTKGLSSYNKNEATTK
jgi:Flp pilus assembly pilin Flp